MNTYQANNFVGKVIKNVDDSCENVITFEFTDGEKVDIWADVELGKSGPGLKANIYVETNSEVG